MGSDDPPFEGTDEENAAAAKIQATHRGKKGRAKANEKKKKQEQEESRKRNNPKIGEAPAKKDKALGGVGGAVLNNANDTAAAAAEQSVEVLLKLFGKDGGAYLRDSSQRNCRDLPMCVSFLIY